MRSMTKKLIITGAAARMERVMYSKRKWIFIVTVMVTMLSGLTGCGKSMENTDQAGNSAVEEEDLPASEEVDGGKKPEADAQDQTAEGEEDAQAPGREGGEDAGSTAGEEGAAFHYINEDKDLYGDIWEVGEGQFTVIEIYMDKTEEGGDIMAAPADDSDEAVKITVIYDDNTKFIKQKIWDGGANHEEREGSAADLQKGFTAEMNGSYEGDVFHAAEILIVEVILN